MEEVTEDPGWFSQRRGSSVRDFFDVCDQSPGAFDAAARALEGAGGALPAGSVEHQAGEARDTLRAARTGRWQPYEQYLMVLGARYSRSGLALSAWHGIANRFQDAIIARAVATFSAEPARLTAVLQVVGEFIERSLLVIASDYYAAKQQREHGVHARHARMIEAAPDAVIEIDEHERITEFNPAAEWTFGYRKVEVIGQPLSAMIIPERLRDRHCAGVARLIAGDEPHMVGQRIKFTAMRADRSEIPVELALVAIDRLDGGRSFVGYLRDLTDQTRAEESLAVRAHAFERAELGLVVSDVTTRRITNVNQAYARMLGYEPHELIGTNGKDLVAPASRAVLPEIERALDEQGRGTCELRLLRKDGTDVLVSASWTTAELRSGAMTRVSTVIDLTERERLEANRIAAQRAFERSAARVEIVSTTAHEFAAASGNSEDLLALVARRLTEILGDCCTVRLISEDGAWLEPSTSFFHRDPAVRELARRVFGTERQRIGEGVAGRVARTGVPELIPVIDAEQAQAITAPAFRAVIGRIGLASALSIPLRSRDRTIGAISILRTTPGNPYTTDDQYLAQDIADRAGLAIDNAVLVTTLEQRVIARTAELETANRELEAFSYSVSHDLRTPLRAIDGFSRVLLKDYESALDADGQRCLQRIRAGTQRMSALIDDLLNLARISRIPLFLDTHDLSALAREVITEIQNHEPARAMPVHIAPGLSARADARLLRIMLENLLNNAWKFTARHAQAEIWVGAQAGAFYVRDTGAGFDMSYAEKLFVPFQRLHAVKDYDGTGIGLATVHRIVTHHGGRIWAEAEIGKGATFFFTLGGSHGAADHSPGRRQ